jgi:hypothetical protein
MMNAFEKTITGTLPSILFTIFCIHFADPTLNSEGDKSPPEYQKSEPHHTRIYLEK